MNHQRFVALARFTPVRFNSLRGESPGARHSPPSNAVIFPFAITKLEKAGNIGTGHTELRCSYGAALRKDVVLSLPLPLSSYLLSLSATWYQFPGKPYPKSQRCLIPHNGLLP